MLTSKLLNSPETKEEINTTLPHVNLNAVVIEEKKNNFNSNVTLASHVSSQETSRTTTVQKDFQTHGQSEKVDVSSSKKGDGFIRKDVKKDFFNDMVIEERPEVVKSITYKLKSHFVNHSIYITLGYIEMPDGRKRPLEIFINSKDLTKTAEFALLGRLLSAIFRRTPNPVFILEELNSLFDPNGGYLSNGRFYASIYAEIAEIIERFFRDIQLLSDSSSSRLSSLIHPLEKNGKSRQPSSKNNTTSLVNESISINNETNTHHSEDVKVRDELLEEVPRNASMVPNIKESSASELNNANLYRICPACDFKTLKFDNGCYICLTCGYSKCE